MFYAVDAGYNPATKYYQVEVKEFNSYEEADEYNESLDQSRYVVPIELDKDYDKSLEILQEEYSYPDYAIKNLN